jgi:hypothetical protein
MKFWIISKYSIVSFKRRIKNVIIQFPLSLFFGVALLIAICFGLVEVYKQVSSILGSLPLNFKEIAIIKLVGACGLVTFITFFILIIAMPSPSKLRPGLTTTPVHFSELWLGSQCIALGLVSIGLTMLLFPVILACINLPWHPETTWKPLLFSGLFTFFLVLRSASLALLTWSFKQWLEIKLHIKGFFHFLLGVCMPLAVGVVLGWTLPQNEINQVIDPLGPVLAKAILFFLPSDLSTITVVPATSGQDLWICIWMLVPGIITFLFFVHILNQLVEPCNINNSASWLSQRITTGGQILQFIIAENKRLLRQRTLFLGYVFLFCLFIIWALAMSQQPSMKTVIIPLAFTLLPFLGTTLPLFSISQDNACSWVFQSSPIGEFRYLVLKQSSISIFIFGLTLLTLIFSTSGNSQIMNVMFWWPFFSQTAGLIGLAFALGGILRTHMRSAQGQVLTSVLFFSLVGISQYIFGLMTVRLPGWTSGMAWLGLFAFAPILILAWKQQYSTQ